MKRFIKILSIPAILLCLVGGVYFGLIRFNTDVLDNIAHHRVERKIDLDTVVYDGWEVSDGANVTLNEEASLRMDFGKKTEVHNLLIGGTFAAQDTMKVYAIDENGQETEVAGKGSKQNKDYLLRTDVEAVALRIVPFETVGQEMSLSEIIVNPRRVHVQVYVLLAAALPILLLLFSMQFQYSFKEYLEKFKRYLPLVKNLVSRDLKVKYRRSVLGYLWSVLNPLLMALVIHTVFSHMFRFQVLYFATYYLIGSLIFTFVIDCTSNGLTSVLDAAPLIKKVYLPKYIFPLQKCTFAFVNMLFGTIAVLVVMLIQQVPFHWTMLLFFIPMFYAFVFAYGMGLILSALAVFFRDIQYLYSVFTQIWLYLTPIIYPEELLLSTKFGFVLKLNPMYYYTHMIRSLVMYGTLPDIREHLMCLFFALFALMAGVTVFKKTQDKFILYF